MRYEWDPRKRESNRAKHGIDFVDASLVLEDDLAITMRDPTLADEDRFVTLGADPAGRVLIVVYTWRNERIRIISARAATSKERRQYEGT